MQFMFVPREIGVHAVPPDASPALVAGDAREAAKLFLVIHLLITLAFAVTGRGSSRRAAR
jgi:hypothetical protein